MSNETSLLKGGNASWDDTTEKITQFSRFGDPRSLKYRIVVLICIAMLQLGPYYAFMALPAIESWVLPRLQIDNSGFGVVLSVNSYVTIVSGVVWGFLFDRFGYPATCITLSLLCIIGSALSAIALQVSSYGLMLFSRIVFGMGSDSLSSAQIAMIGLWFYDEHSGEGATAMGIALAACRIGLMTGLQLSGPIAQQVAPEFALWVGTMMCCVSLVFVMVYWMLESNARDAAIAANVKTRLTAQTYEFNWRAIFSLSSLYWVGLAASALYYWMMFPFLNIASRFFEVKYSVSPQRGGLLSSVPNIAALITALVIGYPIDRFGGRGLIVLIGSCLGVPALALFAWTTVPPEVGIVLLGLGFALVPDAIWSALAHLVHPNDLGLAMGLSTSVIAGGIAIFNAVSGVIIDRAGGYTGVMSFYFGFIASCVGVCVLWNVMDLRRHPCVVNARSEKYAKVEQHPCGRCLSSCRPSLDDKYFAAMHDTEDMIESL